MGKAFFLMVFALLALMPAIASAELSAPDNVKITLDSNSFEFSVTNNSASSNRVSIGFASPASFSHSPLIYSIEPGEKRTYTLKLESIPEDVLGQDYITTLSVKIGEQEFKKEIKVRFESKEEESNALSGFFSLSGSWLAGISSIEFPWITALNILLVIIAVVLIIALIARLYNRRKRKKFEALA